MQLIHIVRGEFENGEGVILGVYPTEAQAQDRCDFIKESPSPGYSFKYVWYQVFDVDAGGGDCYLTQ
jgi:hypothetical protein